MIRKLLDKYFPEKEYLCNLFIMVQKTPDGKYTHTKRRVDAIVMARSNKHLRRRLRSLNRERGVGNMKLFYSLKDGLK